QWVEYKANRRETPADFRNQLSLIFEVLDALGIQRLSVPGYEADDIIATLTTEAEQAGLDVLIVTGDRDVLQLVDEHTTALMTRRGITEMTRFTPEAVTAAPGPGDAAGEAFDVEITLPGPEEVASWLAEHAAGEGRTGVAVSGTWGRGTGNLIGLALATADGAGAYLDPATLTEDDERALAEWLADPGKAKAMNDAKGPIHALAARGFEFAGLTTDTALAAYLALPGQRSFDLADLTLGYLGKELKARDEAAAGQLALDLSGG